MDLNAGLGGGGLEMKMGVRNLCVKFLLRRHHGTEKEKHENVISKI
jgi:hypothetical protein